jgi:CheY-like chemotaxis protein
MKQTANILIIEDLKIAQAIAKEIFTTLECETTVVTTGAEALNKIIIERFDMIFMDIQLPDMNGFEITTTIRSLERNNTHVPIIAVTANFFENFDTRCKNTGFDDYLLKPLSLEAVRHMMLKHLSRSGVGGQN